MNCPNCSRPMLAMFYTMACSRCTRISDPVKPPNHSRKEPGFEYGFIILRGGSTRHDVVGEEKFVFPSEDRARANVLWRGANPYLVTVKSKVAMHYVSTAAYPGDHGYEKHKVVSTVFELKNNQGKLTPRTITFAD